MSHIYIYIYRERERERERINACVFTSETYMYKEIEGVSEKIYVYTRVCVYN
jgi:hypothetical protein